MSEGSTERLERIMEAGFRTLADLTRETNEGLDELRGEVSGLRLEVTELRGDVRGTNERLERVEGRFDNLIAVAGSGDRRLRGDLHELELRVDALEERVS